MSPFAAAAAALAFWRAGLWSAGVPLLGHVFFLAHPLISIATRQLQAGQLPLWNPYEYCGVPLLADPQAGVFTLGHLGFRLFTFEAGLKLDLGLDVGLAFLFTYALACRLGARRSAALLAGLLGSCNGFLYYHSPMTAQADALVWLPGVLLFWIDGRPLLFGAACALCYLGGNPFFVYIALAGCLAARPRRRAAAALAAGGAAALALAAPQLLPAVELFRASTRSGTLAAGAALKYSLSAAALARQLAVPLWNRSASAFVGDPTITSFYVGLPALALAALGLRRARAAAAWAAAGLLLMLGASTPVYPAALRVVPGLALFRFPAQWGALAACGLAVLAARGLEGLRRPARLLLAAAVALDLWLFLAEPPTARASAALLSLKPSTLAAASAGPRVAHAASLLAAQADAVPEGDLEKYWLSQNEGLVPSRGTVFGLREMISYNVYEPRVTSRLARVAASGDRELLRAFGAGALLEGTPNGGYRLRRLADPSPRLTWHGGQGRAASISETPTRLSAVVEASGPGALVWRDTSFPGWRAFVDGREVGVVTTGAGFRELTVETAGTHDFRWIYASAPLSIGACLALCSLFAGLAIALERGFCYP